MPKVFLKGKNGERGYYDVITIMYRRDFEKEYACPYPLLQEATNQCFSGQDSRISELELDKRLFDWRKSLKQFMIKIANTHDSWLESEEQSAPIIRNSEYKKIINSNFGYQMHLIPFTYFILSDDAEERDFDSDVFDLDLEEYLKDKEFPIYDDDSFKEKLHVEGDVKPFIVEEKNFLIKEFANINMYAISDYNEIWIPLRTSDPYLLMMKMGFELKDKVEYGEHIKMYFIRPSSD